MDYQQAGPRQSTRGQPNNRPASSGWRPFALPVGCLVVASVLSSVSWVGLLASIALAGGAALAFRRRLPFEVPTRYRWALVATAALTFIASIGRLERDERSSSPRRATQAQSAEPPASTPRRASTGPEHARSTAASPIPAPPLAHRAADAPGLEARLAEDAAFRALQPRVDAEATRVFLTTVSFLLAQSTAPNAVMRASETRRVKDAAGVVVAFAYRTGTLPAAVDRLARAFLASVEAQGHRGLWAPNDPAYDVTALAAFLQPNDPVVLRELIDARSSGPNPWYPFASRRMVRRPWIPWMAFPGAAHQRMRDLGASIADDVPHECEALGLDVVEVPDPEAGSLRPACGCATGIPFTYETHGDEYPFSVPGGCLVGRRDQGSCPVTFRTRGREYRVNGAADALRPRPLAPEPIWAASSDPATMGPKVPITNAIALGLAQCRRE